MRGALVAGALVWASVAGAAEQGCDRLAWPLDAERGLLTAARDEPVSGLPPLARRLRLGPVSALPKPPERASRIPDDHAGTMTVAIPKSGAYRVTVDAEAWLDVIQRDAYLRPEAFTGARGCQGLRKSVRFRLEEGPVLIQVSGSPNETIAVAVTPEPEAGK